jgi:hypothetical protein
MRSGSGFGNASGLLLRSDSSAEQADRPAHIGTYVLVISRTYCLMVGIVPDDERGHPVTENAADNRETVRH